MRSSAGEHLVHTDEAAPIESTPCLGVAGATEPGTRSSAGEHALHTGGVVGSIPTASTIRQRSKCSVYVIDAGDAGVKIGISGKPKKRAHSLRTSTSHRIDIFKTWALKNTDAARSVEKAAHKALRQFRLRGEWFSIRPQEAVAVIEHIMAGDERRASMLVTAIRRMKAFADLGAEDDRVARRSRGEQREALFERSARFRRLGVTAYKRGLSLGVAKNEWDEVLL